MVVRNGRRYLPAALECVRRQSAAPAEIVAIVGVSEDGTTSYLEAQPDVRVVRQAGSGLADARNQGIEEAREERIAFLDHDDLWRPRKMEAQLGVLDLFDRSAASITRFRIVHDADPNNPALVKTSADLLPRLGWTPSALLAHRDLFRTVGGFDPAAGMGCDTDWFRRLRLSNAPCGVASGVLLDKRVHEANLSRDHANNRAAMFRVLQKHRAEQRRQ
jgi:glycosyltransferase involved in cell wall biosynthesis